MAIKCLQHSILSSEGQEKGIHDLMEFMASFTLVAQIRVTLRGHFLPILPDYYYILNGLIATA